MHIRSARNATFYMSLFMMLLLCTGLGLLLFFVATDTADTDYGLLACSFIFFALFAYAAYKYTKSTPAITFSDDGIQFNGRTYGWSQLQNVKMDTKETFRFLWAGQQMDAIVLYFDDGTSHVVFVKMMNNIPEIRAAINARIKPDGIIDTSPSEEEIKKSNSPQMKRAASRIKYYMFGYLALMMLISILTSVFNVSKQTETLEKVLLVLTSIAGIIGLRYFIQREVRKATEDYNNNQ